MSVEIYFSKVTLVRVRVEVGEKMSKSFKLKTPDLPIAVSNHKSLTCMISSITTIDQGPPYYATPPAIVWSHFISEMKRIF